MSAKIVYGFIITVEDVCEMFPERVQEAKEDLSEGEEDVNYDAIVEQAVNITEGIDADYAYRESAVDGFPSESSTHVIGVVKRSITYRYSGVMSVPEITDEDRKKIEVFVESNPAFKGRPCGIHVLVEDGR
jgi:hypothetical protein